MSAPRRPDTLAGGLVVIALGVWILLDAADVLEVGYGALASALIAAAGIVLLVGGLARRG